MSFRATIALGVVFAALAGYLYFVERHRDVGDESDRAVLDFEAETIDSIELEHPGRTVVVRRDGEDWQMLEPVNAPADRRSVDNLIDALAKCRSSRTLEDVEDLASFGLDVPSATVTLSAGGKALPALRVGKKTPIGAQVYVQLAGQPSILLTEASFAARIDKKAADLRDKTILAFDTATVERITIARRGREPTVLQGEDGVWTLTAPGEHDADQTAVRSYVSTLRSMRATDFLSEEPADPKHYGLDKPLLRVTLGTGGDEMALRVGNEREGKLRVQTNQRPTVYGVGTWLKDSLDKDAGHFRDKTIARFSEDDAASLRIDDAGVDPIVLRKQSDQWRVADPPAEAVQQGDLQSSRIDELVGELSNLEGYEIAADAPFDAAAFGLATPARTITVRDDGDAVVATVALGRRERDGVSEYTAMAKDGASVFLIHADRAQRLMVERHELVSKSSEGTPPPVPDAGADDGIDENPLDDAATAGEEG